MGTRKTVIIAICMCFFLYGCGHYFHFDSKQGANSGAPERAEDLSNLYYYTTNSMGPVKLTHADKGKKKVYIQKVEEALRHFYQVAHDARKRGDVSNTKALGLEANNYIRSYVDPILNDAEATENLETRAEVAKLYLVTASLYYEIAGYYKANQYLTQLTHLFGEAFLLGITTDTMDSKFNTVAEGAAHLQKKIYLKMSNTNSDGFA